MNNKKIAVFFDCDNIHGIYVEDVLSELANIGEVVIRQAVKDWTNPHHKEWNSKLLQENGIEPIQVFPYKKGKNTADLRIVRGVMEILTSSIIDTIAIVSADSDFIDLARTIKAKGFVAIGFGESNTRLPIKNSYTKFIDLPIQVKQKIINSNDYISLLKDAISNQEDDNGYARVSQIGSYLLNKSSSFNAKNYGCRTWGEIIKKHSDIFEIDYHDLKKSVMLVRMN